MQAFNGRAHDSLTPYLRRDVRGVHPSPSHYQSYLKSALVDSTWDQLRPHLAETRLSAGARFESRIVYPELVCREALINAIAHRDYSQEGRGIEIYVFDDRLEVTSPGALLSTVTVADLLRLEGTHQSRNALIARVLREAGYMRELGEGVRRIFELMKSNELAPPEILNRPDQFTVTLHHKSLYSPEHVVWLEEFVEFDLTREEKVIVVLGYGGREIAPNDIFRNLGIDDTEHYRQLVSSLQQKGILKTTLTKAEVRNSARSKRVGARDIPKFKIVRPEAKREKREQRADQDEGSGSVARLFVCNLPSAVREEELVEAFSRFGEVQEVVVPRNGSSSKGFAFVQLDNLSSALEALREGERMIVAGRRLVVRPARPRHAAE